MNKGITLTELAALIDEKAETHNDLLVDTTGMTVTEHAEVLLKDEIRPHPVNQWAHNQLATITGIPRLYYNKLKDEDPALLAINANRWLAEDEPKTKMVRTEDGMVRAFLSDHYKRIDNRPMLYQALEAISELPQKPVILSTNRTDQRMYLKLLFPDIGTALNTNRGKEEIHPGVMISNSEVGGGTFTVTGFFFNGFCYNGCVYGLKEMDKVARPHRGSRMVGEGSIIYQDDTLEAEVKALGLKTRDIINGYSSPAIFDRMVSQFRRAIDSPQMVNPEKGVEKLAKVVGLSDKERERVLVNLIEDRDYSLWGAANAVTKMSDFTKSYERATEFEGLGQRIIDMPNSEWTRIQEAA